LKLTKLICFVIALIIICTAFIFTDTRSEKLTPLPLIDYIQVNKSSRTLSLYHHGIIIKTYKIALGFSPIGAKVKEGDGKTPQGLYYISSKNPKSQYHLSLKISYPNATDKKHAEKLGVSPGGDIMLHGLPKLFAWIGKYHLMKDWTRGCIAVTNHEIEEIYQSAPVGTPIKITP
jgi:murein L,D-transpeptidase YafK